MKSKAKTLQINIFETARCKFLNRRFVKRMVMDILNCEGHQQIETVNVIIADARYMKELNQRYFNKNKSTNVISFELGNTVELYICKEESLTEYDFYYYLAHGLLHTIGYDHADRKANRLMDNRCRYYLKKFSVL